MERFKSLLCIVGLVSSLFLNTRITMAQNEATLNLIAGTGGGRLTIDGKYVVDMKANAVQPLTLAPGRHTVRLERDGYFPVEEELVLRPGMATVVNLEQHSILPSPPNGSGGRVTVVPKGSPRISLSLNPSEKFDFDQNAKVVNGGDVMLLPIGESIVPLREARLAKVSNLAFENISFDILRRQTFSFSSVKLTPGLIIGVLTNGGSYVKLRIERISGDVTMTVVTFAN